MSPKLENTFIALIAAAATLMLAAVLAAAQALSLGLGMVPGMEAADTPAAAAGHDGEECAQTAECAPAAAPVSARAALPSLTMPYFSFAPLLPRRAGR